MMDSYWMPSHQASICPPTILHYFFTSCSSRFIPGPFPLWLSSALFFIYFLLILFIFFAENGKSSSSNSQNHIQSGTPALFTTRNNTRIIAQRGGLAILPCAIKWNPSATVCIRMNANVNGKCEVGIESKWNGRKKKTAKKKLSDQIKQNRAKTR